MDKTLHGLRDALNDFSGPIEQEGLIAMNNYARHSLGDILHQLLISDDSCLRRQFEMRAVPAGFVSVTLARHFKLGFEGPRVVLHLWPERGIDVASSQAHSHFVPFHSVTVFGKIEHAFYELRSGGNAPHSFFRRDGKTFIQEVQDPVGFDVEEQLIVPEGDGIFLPSSRIHTVTVSPRCLTIAAESAPDTNLVHILSLAGGQIDIDRDMSAMQAANDALWGNIGLVRAQILAFKNIL